MSNTKDFLTKFNQAWVDHDVETVVNGVTDDIHFRMAMDDKGIQGKQAFKAWLSEMANPEYKISLTTERLFVSGDDAVLSGVMDMTEPDGTKRKFAFCDLYKMRDGKVAELQAYFMSDKADAGCPGSEDKN
ncbi:nuclear transport factor 2 family protein [Aliidiomarina sp. Khilg15.8]